MNEKREGKEMKHDIEKYRQLYLRFASETEDWSAGKFERWLWDVVGMDCHDTPSITWLDKHLKDEISKHRPFVGLLIDTYTAEAINAHVLDYIKERRGMGLSFGNFCKWLQSKDGNAPSLSWMNKHHKEHVENRIALVDKEHVEKRCVEKAGYNISLAEFVSPINAIIENANDTGWPIRPFTNRPECDEFGFSRRRLGDRALRIGDILRSSYGLKENDAFYYWAKQSFGYAYSYDISWLISELPLLQTGEVSIAALTSMFEESLLYYTELAYFPIEWFCGGFSTEKKWQYDECMRQLKEVDIEHSIKSLLYMVAIVSGEPTNNIVYVYDDMYETFLWETEEMDVEKHKLLFAAHFYHAYNRLIDKALYKAEKLYLSNKYRALDVLYKYWSTCKDTGLPPDILYAEQNRVPPAFTGNDYNSESILADYHARYGYETWTQKQKDLLKKIQQRHAHDYMRFSATDFEDVNKFKFVGRRIQWSLDPDAPYKAFVAYCIKTIRRHKDVYQKLPKEDKSKELWDRNQLDYVVKNLQCVLAHPDIYPLHPNCVSYIEKLLVDIVELWKWKGERVCAEYLIDHGYKVSPQASFSDCVYKGKLYFDIKAVKDGQMCLVEFDGDQHYTYTPRFHKSEADFKIQQERDRIKNEYCQSKGIPLYRVRKEDLRHLSEVLPT